MFSYFIDHRRTTAGPIIALLTLCSAAAQGQSGLAALRYLKTYQASDKVVIYRGSTAVIDAFGSEVTHLPSNLTITNATGGTPAGFSLAFAGTSFDALAGGTAQRVGVTSTSSAAAGDYLVSFMAFSTKRSFLVHLVEDGTVNSITKSSTTTLTSPLSSQFDVPTGTFTLAGSTSSTPTVTTVIGSPITLNVGGPGWSEGHVNLGTLSTSATIEILSRSATGMSFKLTPLRPFKTTINAGKLFTGPLAQDTCGSLCAAAGSGAINLVVGVDLAITGMSPLVVSPSGTVTLTGRNMTPESYTATVLYRPKGGGTTQSVTPTLSSTSATFSAPSDARPDSIILLYQSNTSFPDILITPSLFLPFPLYVKVPPQIAKTDTATSSGAFVIRGGASTKIHGANLLSTAEVFAAGTPGVTRTPTTVTFAGQPLTVQQAVTHLLSHEDELTLTPPSSSSAQTGTLTITTAGGTKSIDNVMFAPPPTVSSLTVQGANNSTATLTSGATLRTNTSYTVNGSNVNLLVGDRAFPPTISVGGTSVTNVGGAATPSTQQIISIPFTTSGLVPLVLRTLGGSVTFGSFKVSAPFALPAISSMSVAPSPGIGGARLTATIAFASALPTSTTDTGFIDVTSSNGSDVVPPLVRIPVLSNPLTVQVPTNVVGTQRTVNLTATSNGAATQSSTATSVVLQPLQVAQLTIQTPLVSGGAGSSGTIRLNANSASPVTVQLTSSNPSVVTVPPSVTVSGQSASFSITTSVVAATVPVTISAAFGGVTQTGSMTVTTPRVQSVRLSRSSIASLDTSSLIVTLDAAPLVADTISLSVSDTTAVGSLTRVIMTSQTKTIPLRGRVLNAARSATIVAGGENSHITISVVPLTMTMSLSPTTTTAGVGVTATVTLSAVVSAPAGQAFSHTSTSSDTSVVRNSAINTGGGNFANGQTVVVFSVPTVGPQTQAKTTTITYRLHLTGNTVDPAVDALLPSVTATLTVNP
jgi:hypothetical protein